MRILISAIGLLLVSGGSALAGSSSFQRSCEDIRLEQSGNDIYVVAQCKDRQGNFHGADMLLTGYHNMDGTLVHQGFESASFQRSCDQFRLDARRKRVVLTANCRRIDGSYLDSSIEVTDIHNDNGNLVGGGY